MKFLRCWVSYEPVEAGRPVLNPSDESIVHIPDRRIALIRPFGKWDVTIIETVNGRSYYAPGKAEDIIAALSEVRP